MYLFVTIPENQFCKNVVSERKRGDEKVQREYTFDDSILENTHGTQWKNKLSHSSLYKWYHNSRIMKIEKTVQVFYPREAPLREDKNIKENTSGENRSRFSRQRKLKENSRNAIILK